MITVLPYPKCSDVVKSLARPENLTFIIASGATARRIGRRARRSQRLAGHFPAFLLVMAGALLYMVDFNGGAPDAKSNPRSPNHRPSLRSSLLGEDNRNIDSSTSYQRHRHFPHPRFEQGRRQYVAKRDVFSLARRASGPNALGLAGGGDADMKAADGGAKEASDEYKAGQVVSLSEDGSLKKEIFKVGEGESTPKRGDTVFAHYVGKLDDGTIFDSSRERNEAFRFPVGRGRVIKGWDVGIMTMRKGEIVKLTCPPLYAYGARGSPPKIPPEATLHFEIELLKWVQGDDLTGDTGVMKKILLKGDKWQSPKEGDDITISWKGRVDGKEFASAEKQVVSLGKTKMVEAFKRALLKMKKKEKCLLTVTPQYAAADNGIGSPPTASTPPETIEYELTLHTWDPIDDMTGDGGHFQQTK
eukprot:jgi/Bigna1/142955/aug1.74_g17663